MLQNFTFLPVASVMHLKFSNWNRLKNCLRRNYSILSVFWRKIIYLLIFLFVISEPKTNSFFLIKPICYTCVFPKLKKMSSFVKLYMYLKQVWVRNTHCIKCTYIHVNTMFSGPSGYLNWIFSTRINSRPFQLSHGWWADFACHTGSGFLTLYTLTWCLTNADSGECCVLITTGT